jgi:hypothetical protein
VEYTFRPYTPQEEPESPLSIAGWAILLSTFATLVPAFIPPHFLDPEWQMRIMNQCVEIAMLPLLAIALILHGRPLTITLKRLKRFRWILVLCLLLSLAYLGMVPLAVRDNQLITRKIQSRMNAATAAQSQQTDKVLEALAKSQSVQDVKMVGSMLNLTPALEKYALSQPDISVEALRDWIQSRVYMGEQDQRRSIFETGENSRLQLLRDTAKLAVLAFMAGSFYLVLFVRNRNVFQRHGLWPLPVTRDF